MQPIVRASVDPTLLNDPNKRVLRSGNFTNSTSGYVKTSKVRHVTTEKKDKEEKVAHTIIKSDKNERKNDRAYEFANKVVKLVPPKIEAGTIAEKIYCTRPRRDGAFKISCDQIGSAAAPKTLVNCYGHGGSGWTTLFGSVQRAIDLFLKTNPAKATPIRIIGSGCMGYTMAIELKRQGYNVVGITTKSLYDSPSWRAAGYFATVSLATSKEEQANVDQICMNTFDMYEQIDKGSHPYLKKECVRFMPVYCSADTESGIEDLEKKGRIPKKEAVTLDFGNGVTHRNFVRYYTYFMNTTTLMRELIEEAKRLQIPVAIKEVKSFDEVAEPVVVNCAGLGGRELNNDTAMNAVRGHLVALNEEAGEKHMDYMIYTKVKQDGKEEYVYMFPKDISVTPENTAGKVCRAVLGGTFIVGFDKESKERQKEIDRVEMERMLERNNQFFHGKPNAAAAK